MLNNGWNQTVPRISDRKNGSKTPILVPPPQNLRTPNKLFAEVAKVTSREAGRAWVFALALGTVVAWAITGPFFHFSDTWFSSFKIRKIETQLPFK